MDEFSIYLVIVGVVLVAGMVAAGFTEAAKERAKPEVVAACMAVPDMQYKYGNCVPV